MGVNLTNKAIQDTYEGLVQISGSLLTDGTGSLIPSLDVSASFATSASHATFAETAGGAVDVNALYTASISDANITFTKGDASTFDIEVNNVSSSISASYATTATSASHAVSSDTAISASHAVFADTAGFATDINALYTASVSDATISFLKGGGGTFPITINNVANAVSASYAVSASQATTASYAENASIPTLAEVLTAGNTTLSGQSIIISGSGLITRTFDGDGIISGIAGGDYTIKAGSVNARLVLQGNGNNDNIIKLDTNGVQISGSVGIQDDITLGGDLTGLASNINVNSITASFASFSSASIGYLQSITGSAKIIGDAFIILNNNTPTERYAGLVVQDSGSTQNTASFEFDGQTNDWFYEYTDDGGATTEHGVALFGAEYSTKGSPSYPATNVLQKGDGGHHLLDSSITDDGTNVSVNANISASGLISASTYYGDGSNLTGISTTPFPFTGSAGISGSLDVDGSITQGTTNTNSGDYTTILSSDASTLGAGVVRSIILASSGSSHSTTQTQNTAIIASQNGSILSTNSATQAGGIFGAQNATLSTGEVRASVILGGASSTITGKMCAIVGSENASVGSYSNFAGGGFNLQINGDKSAVLGGIGARVNGGTNNAVIVGNGNQVNGSQNAVVAGSSNNISSGENSAIIAGSGNTNTQNRSVVIGGSSLSTSKADEVVVPNLSVYGEIEQGDTNSNLGTNTAILSSGDSLISASVLDSAIIASTGSYQSSTQPGRTAIIASDNSYIDSTSAGNNDDIALIGTLNSRFTGGGARQSVIMATNGAYNNGSRFSFVGGGENHVMEGYYANAIVGGSSNRMIRGTNSAMAGGGSNRVGNTSQTDYGFIGGGSNNYLDGQNGAIIAGTGGRNTQLRAVILGGESNKINGGQGGIVAGGINNIVGHDRSVILGGASLTTTKADEVVVEHLSTNGAVVQDVKALSIVANVAELDASLGNLFTLTLQNGVNTELQLTNQSAGQSFQVQITNNATSAGTISFDSQFDFEGGTAFTATASTNAVDILTFVCFGGGNVQCVGASNFS